MAANPVPTTPEPRTQLVIPIGMQDGWTWREVLEFLLGAFQFAASDEELHISIVRRKDSA